MAAVPSREPTLITQVISNLVGGVSQKSDSQRNPTETSEIINGLLSPSEGLKKRPPSKLLYHFTRPADTALVPGGIFTHLINRSDTEQYVLSCMDHDLRVISLIDGSVKTVTFPDGKGYINSDAPGLDYRAVTVGDYTFLINRTKTVASLSSPTSTAASYEALVWVQVGDYGVDYNITCEGETFTFRTNSSYRDEVTTTAIAKALFGRLNRGCDHTTFRIFGTFTAGDTVTVTPVSPSSTALVYTVVLDPITGAVESNHSIARGICLLMNKASFAADGYAYPCSDDPQIALVGDGLFWYGNTIAATHTFTIATSGAGGVANILHDTDTHIVDAVLNGSTIKIVKADASDFTITAHDGLGDASIRSIKGLVQSFGDLPARAVNGFRVEVTGEDRSLTSSFFVKYTDSSTSSTEGVWREDLKGGERTSLDAATMPWILVRQSDGTFIFSKATWDARLVGKLATGNAPMPSFVGKKVNDISTFKNRLMVISDEDDVVLTSIGNYFNFFRLSVQQVLDEDIIDVSVNVIDGRSLNHIVPFDSDCILWGDKQQFLFGSGKEPLTPKTASAPAITAFDNSAQAKPVQVGKNVFFSLGKTTACTVSEFYRDSTGATSDALPITGEIPSYILGNPLQLSGSESIRMVAQLTLAGSSDVYIYNYLRQGDSLVQSAWSTWRFHNSTVLSCNLLKDTIVITTQRGVQVFLEKITVNPDDADGIEEQLTYVDLRFDNSLSGVSAAYSSGTTTWTLPFDIPDDSSHPLAVYRKQILHSSANDYLIGGGVFTRPAANQIACTGDYHLVSVWIGLLYDHTVTMSKLYKREQAQDGQVVSATDVTTQLRKGKLRYKNTGYLSAVVTVTGNSTPYTYAVDNPIHVTAGELDVPLLANNERISVVLKNNTSRASSILGFSWDALISQKTRR